MHRSTTEPWADYVWNPITGCLKDCEFCHLKSQYKRFSGDIRYNRSLKDRYAVENNTFVLDQKFTSSKRGTLSFPFRGQPTYHRYRLGNLDQLKAGEVVAVSTAGDAFGPWISDWMLHEIFQVCKDHPLNRYVFMTRYPERLTKLADSGVLPKGDFWYGTSVDHQTDSIFVRDGYHCFLSVKPVLEEIEIPSGIEWIILGAYDRWTPAIAHREVSESVQLDLIEGMIRQAQIKNVPVYVDRDGLKSGTEDPRDIPRAMASDDEYVQERRSGYCLKCNMPHPKKEMYPLITYPTRNTTVTLGYICRRCWKTWCHEIGIADDIAHTVEEKRDGRGKGTEE